MAKRMGARSPTACSALARASSELSPIALSSMRAKWGYRTVGTINLAGMEAPEPLECKSPSQVRPGGSVAFPAAEYDYNSNWTPLLAGLSPAGMAASLAAPDPSRADRHIQERNTSMMRTSVVALALSAGVILSGSALAESPKFDGTWSVSLVADGGLCGSGTSSTLMVQNGSVRAGGAGVSVSGQVGASGSVSLALQKSGVQGTASGKLSGSSGSGSWTVSSMGCSGHWTARRA